VQLIHVSAILVLYEAPGIAVQLPVVSKNVKPITWRGDGEKGTQAKLLDAER